MMDSLTGRQYRSGEGQRDDIIDKFFASQYVWTFTKNWTFLSLSNLGPVISMFPMNYEVCADSF